MTLGRTTLLIGFAFLGFLLGSVAYMAFDWIFVNAAIGIQPVPILTILSAPWFISGIAGSLLSIAILYVSARHLGDK